MRPIDRGIWRAAWLASGAVCAMMIATACSSSSSSQAGAGGSGGSATGSGGSGGSSTGGSGGTTGAGGSSGSGGATGAGGSGGAGGAAGAGGSGGAGGSTDAGTGWLDPPAVPSALEPPSGAALAAHFRGVGTQVYTCTASGGGDGGADAAATTYSWVLKTPDARLFDERGVQVGTHTMGPTWTYTVDGSSVVGVKIQQSPGATGAIPWLLLRAGSNAGSGLFSDVTYVQRVNTMGGVALTTGCDATTVNMDEAISYSADYYFYTGGNSDGGTGDATNG